jgi:hypothetical protein
LVPTFSDDESSRLAGTKEQKSVTEKKKREQENGRSTSPNKSPQQKKEREKTRMEAAPSPDVFLSAGRDLMGNAHRDHLLQRRVVARFHTLIGTSPILCSHLWGRLDPTVEISGAARPKHLLWALLFLRHYGTEILNSTVTGADEKTFRKWVWLFVNSISNLHAEVILWGNRFNGATDPATLPGHTVSVDGTHCPIQEVHPFWPGWKSFKIGGAALAYEICLSISQGHIVWINGPFPAGAWPDLKIFDSHLMTELEEGEKVLADDGYRGRERYVTIANRFELNQVKKNIKARQEQINSRLKNWGCLSNVFRHRVDQHFAVFHAVAVITQLEIELGISVQYEVA